MGPSRTAGGAARLLAAAVVAPVLAQTTNSTTPSVSQPELLEKLVRKATARRR